MGRSIPQVAQTMNSALLKKLADLLQNPCLCRLLHREADSFKLTHWKPFYWTVLWMSLPHSTEISLAFSQTIVNSRESHWRMTPMRPAVSSSTKWSMKKKAEGRGRFDSFNFSHTRKMNYQKLYLHFTIIRNSCALWKHGTRGFCDFVDPRDQQEIDCRHGKRPHP